ncbi:MAG: leucyl aminopeptidase, partial [Beijerinckiaceae bacterium]
MGQTFSISLKDFHTSTEATVVLLVTETFAFPDVAARLGPVADVVRRVAAIEAFTGKALSVLTVTGSSELSCERLIVVGLGPDDKLAATDWAVVGGLIAGRLKRGAASMFAAIGDQPLSPHEAADVALGMRLRNYTFDAYKTKKGDDAPAGDIEVSLCVADIAATRKARKQRDAVVEGVILARNLVNEPPNVLFPKEFAKRAGKLSKLGVEIDVLGEKALEKLGMGALLGVGQGSEHESQVVVMRWNGAKDKDAQPVAFIGKGVTFDTGGISIKPAGGMEDMKGDMGGAACVTGLMHALAARKAKVNAIGVIGLVENMPDGKAQRPGDIVTSMSGQTIEIINTDAEGRLVLADVLWHTQGAFKPKFMVNLATLTGAVLVALGNEHAGLFSNNDELANRLTTAGVATGERVWRLPLDPAYDKLIDSKFADVKNSGGRHAGSITAAQFLQRFVNDCPWAHLDI